MKIIFLDFDGVLNSTKSIKLTGTDDINLWYVMRLNKLTAATGAKIVVSSTWRLFNTLEKLQLILKEVCFMGEVIDVTPSIRNAQRGEELNIESFVILDDDSDMFPHMNRLVKTNVNFGLQNEHIIKAIELLNVNI